MPNTASSQNTSFAPSCLSPVEDSRVACNFINGHNGHSSMAMNTTMTTTTGMGMTMTTATATNTAPTANIYQERKLPLRKYHEPPDTLVRQELVPSYDELYG